MESIDPREIAAFATNAGYHTSFLPAGTVFLPPEDQVDPEDRPWCPDGSRQREAKSLEQILADSDDSDSVDYNKERARLEALFGSV